MIPPTFAAMSITTNDFIRVATSDRKNPRTVLNKTSFSFSGYLLGDTRGLAITMIGTNAEFSTKNFAVVAMLSIPMPASARSPQLSDQWSGRLHVRRHQASVPSAMPARRITVQMSAMKSGIPRAIGT
jgi:hypothetical protein